MGMRFRKGGTDSTNTSGQTLFTSDTVEVLVGLSEGPIFGPVTADDISKSIYLDDTPLSDQNGILNFVDDQGRPSFTMLEFKPGQANDPKVILQLGGFTTPVNISTQLASNTPLTRLGTQTQIDALDFRFAVSALYVSDPKKGMLASTLDLKLEYKAVSSPTWLPALSANIDPGNDTGHSYGFATDIPTSTVTGAPVVDGTQSAAAIDTVTGTLYRWDDNTLAWETPTPTEVTGTYKRYPDGRRLFSGAGTPADAVEGDLWWRSNTELLIFNGMSWVFGMAGPTIEPNTTLADGVVHIEKKITRTTVQEVRVFVPRIDEPYEFRVTKLSQDSSTSTTTQVLNEVQWESLGQVKITPWDFPNLATMHMIGIATDQFSSLPTWNGLYRGRLIKVPSNYDPVARTYTGTWDGTFQIAYTNNPAWVLMDFVENTRYGLSSIYPHVCNRWSFYDWAVWCDEDVGGRPRFTFNSYIQEPRDAKEMAQYIAGAACARFVEDGNGNVDVIVDKDEPAVAVFTRENVTKDGFTYSYTDRQSRPNAITVSFISPDLNWQVDRRLVSDEADISAYGRVPLDFTAVGCTNVEEALARARYRLVSSLTEKATVKFSTQRKGRYLRPYQIVLIADPSMGYGISGRIKTQDGPRQVTLRDSVHLEPGFSYVATFDTVDETGLAPFKTVRVNITTGPGETKVVTFDADLPTLAPQAVFAIECLEDIGTPKPFRILNIEAPDGDADHIEIVALEVNRTKWSFIDGTTDTITSVPYTNLSGGVEPPTALQFAIENRAAGSTYEQVGVLSWEASTTKLIRRYEVSMQVDGGVATSVGNATGTSIEIPSVPVSKITFFVTAVNVFEKKSNIASLTIDLRGQVRPVNPPQNLHLVDAFSETVFDTPNVTFAWDPPQADAAFSHYEVEVIDVGTASVVRRTNTGLSRNWTYTYADNQQDGLRRDFKVFVYAVDALDNQSTPALLEVSNPAPAAPTLSNVQGVFGGVQLQLSAAADRDVAGVLIWLSTSATFDPITTPPVVDTTYQRSIIIGTEFTGQVWLRAAYYDSFSKAPAELNISTAIAADANVLDLGGRTAEEWSADFEEVLLQGAQVTKDAAYLADAVMTAIMTGKGNKDVLDARTLINGQPVGAFAKNEQTRTNDLFDTFDLIGVKTADGTGFILDTSSVKISPTESMADRYSAITIDRNSAISAAFVTNAHLWTDGINLNATAMSLLGAMDATHSAFVLNQSTVKWTSTETLADHLNSVQSSLLGSIAAASTDMHTWVNTQSAGAQWITDLEVSFGNNFKAHMTQAFEISTTLGGRATLSIDYNGYVTGTEVYNTGHSGGLIIYGDYFGLVDPNGGSPYIPFKYESGVFYLRNVVAEKVKIGTLTADHIISDQLMRTFTGAWSVDVDCGPAYNGSPDVILFLYAELSTSTATAAGRVYTVTRNDGFVVGHFNCYCPGLWGGAPASCIMKDTPGAGSHTYTISEAATPGSGPSGTSAIQMVANVQRN